MKLNLNREKFAVIDGAFSVLKEDPRNVAACKLLKDSLESSFGVTFDITIIDCINNQPFFVMSVFPDMSTMDKIISAIMSEDNKKDDTVKKLWQQVNHWTIEIDSRLLNSTIIDCTNKELTALVLHEVGHIICTNSIPSRIITILQYEVAKTNMNNKILLKDNLFRKILSLPILNACISDSKKLGIDVKTEIKADNFAKKMGYQKELASVLTKLIKATATQKGGSLNDNMRKMTNFSLDTVEQLRTRQDNLMKKNLFTLKTECVSPYIKEVITEYCDLLFKDYEDSSICDGKKIEIMEERADKLLNDDKIITEFFIFGGKQLKRVEPTEIDYIAVKISAIKNESDKMMLISYLYSKLDMIDYYIAILNNPKISRKYIIPNTLEQLTSMRKRLVMLREEILNYKIPEKNKGLLVAWADGYEG